MSRTHLEALNDEVAGWFVDPSMTWADRTKRLNHCLRLEGDMILRVPLESLGHALRNVRYWYEQYGSERCANNLEMVFSSRPEWFNTDNRVRNLAVQANYLISLGRILPASGSFPTSATRLVMRSQTPLFFPASEDDGPIPFIGDKDVKDESVSREGSQGLGKGDEADKVDEPPEFDVDALFSAERALECTVLNNPPFVIFRRKSIFLLQRLTSRFLTFLLRVLDLSSVLLLILWLHPLIL
ncbi:hypothetical protein EUX98_g8367 [Antrodiella citrinella]|uniref:Uncharacterized protein n=1 Tax=Antrodiella citrinella TaxID=2447956 RepID=A0A4S4M856_9APHY|nr:hypothetical protein EUX98_g8367 [Antrodiella citrinella]